MINYLARVTRPDIAVSVHQLARFSDSPRLCHENAARFLGKYLAATRENGILFEPDIKSFCTDTSKLL